MTRKPKTPFETEEFLKLRKKWYDKLARSGFKDIEHISWKDGQSMPVLSGFSHMDAVRYFREDKADFYYLAVHEQHFVNRTYGPKSWQAKAWALYADGKGIAKCAKEVSRPVGQVTRFVNEIKGRILMDCNKFVTNA